MRFRRKQMIEVEATFAEHTRADCDLGGCDICLSYWELLDLMLRARGAAARLPLPAAPEEQQ